MQPTHPIRLGLALNASALNFDVLNLPKEANEIAQSALDSAHRELEKMKSSLDSYDISNLKRARTLYDLLKSTHEQRVDGKEGEEADN